MSNWIERHALKSFITYTLLIVFSTWAITEFIINKSKINLFKIQINNLETRLNLEQGKEEYLKSQLYQLQEENNKFENWLRSKPGSIPFLENKVDELEKHKKILLDKIALFQKKVTPSGWEPVVESLQPKIPAKYRRVEKIKIGESFEDEVTTVSIGVRVISRNYTAELFTKSLGQNHSDLKNIGPGYSWVYEHEQKKYKFSITKVNWITEIVEIEIKEL